MCTTAVLSSYCLMQRLHTRSEGLLHLKPGRFNTTSGRLGFPVFPDEHEMLQQPYEISPAAVSPNGILSGQTRSIKQRKNRGPVQPQQLPSSGNESRGRGGMDCGYLSFLTWVEARGLNLFTPGAGAAWEIFDIDRPPHVSMFCLSSPFSSSCNNKLLRFAPI